MIVCIFLPAKEWYWITILNNQIWILSPRFFSFASDIWDSRIIFKGSCFHSYQCSINVKTKGGYVINEYVDIGTSKTFLFCLASLHSPHLFTYEVNQNFFKSTTFQHLTSDKYVHVFNKKDKSQGFWPNSRHSPTFNFVHKRHTYALNSGNLLMFKYELQLFHFLGDMACTLVNLRLSILLMNVWGARWNSKVSLYHHSPTDDSRTEKSPPTPPMSTAIFKSLYLNLDIFSQWFYNYY